MCEAKGGALCGGIPAAAAAANHPFVTANCKSDCVNACKQTNSHASSGGGGGVAVAACREEAKSKEGQKDE